MLKLFLFLILSTINSSVLSQSKNNQHDKACGLNEKSRILARLIINDPKQNRTKLKCSYLLSKIAAEKAKEMSKTTRVKHRAPNKRLIDKGYPLSSVYPRLFENNVEAVAGGMSDPEEVWIGFKGSDAHRTHLLAEHEFYMLQDEIGVGFVSDPKTPHVEYWAVYVAHRKEEKQYKGEIAKSKD